MKKKILALILVIAACVSLVTGIVCAKQVTESIKVVYNNIKILIDGKEYQPKDANGNVVEPFIYNGTTYLPVRAIANAFDKDVDWEAQTATVTLGTKNYDWLDQMGMADYTYSSSKNTMAAISAKTKMSDGMIYDRGIMFTVNDYYSDSGTVKNNDGTVENYQTVSYYLNGNYTTLEGTITHQDISPFSGTESSSIKIYGDGKLIYTSPVISSGMKSTNFSVNVSGISLLKIHVAPLQADFSGQYSYPCIADARLAKK